MRFLYADGVTQDELDDKLRTADRVGAGGYILVSALNLLYFGVENVHNATYAIAHHYPGGASMFWGAAGAAFVNFALHAYVTAGASASRRWAFATGALLITQRMILSATTPIPYVVGWKSVVTYTLEACLFLYFSGRYFQLTRELLVRKGVIKT